MNNPLHPKRALITGSTGYIGSNLVHHLLKQGWEVHILTRQNSNLRALGNAINQITVHCHDGTSSNMVEAIASAKPDIVFHLASLFLAQHRTNDIAALITSNLLFSTQLLEAMVLNGVQYLVNTGTSWQHYNNEDYNPVNLYAATKQAFEDIITYYVEAHNLKVTTLSLFDTYGPNDPRAKLIALLWKTAVTQEPLSMSPGEQLIDIVHINDVIKAYLLAAKALLDQEKGHTRYGISSGNPMRLRDLVALFEKATKTTLPISFGGRPYRPREVMKPWTKFASLPGWYETITFEQGVIETRPPLHDII